MYKNALEYMDEHGSRTMDAINYLFDKNTKNDIKEKLVELILLTVPDCEEPMATERWELVWNIIQTMI